MDHVNSYHYNERRRRRHGPPRITSKTATRKTQQYHQVVLGYMCVIGLVWCLVNCVHVLQSLEKTSDESTSLWFGISTRSLIDTYMSDSNKHSSDARQQEDNPALGELIQGKERILDMLLDAGITEIDKETLKQLPTWSQVVKLYGSTPRIHGLDSCATYQKIIPPYDASVASAGAFNSGTNLLAELLIHNCHIEPRMQHYGQQNRGIRWQVNWGKHTPPELRSTHATYGDGKVKNEDLLPAVTIRDPYVWFQSMCRHNYATQWFHDDAHCPNFVPNDIDRKAFVEQDYPHRIEKPQHFTNFTLADGVVPVRVNYKAITKYHKSLAHMWNDWYNDYFTTADFPFVMVRFEDLMFHAPKVTEEVCRCAGGTLNRGKFKYVVDSAKKGTRQHGSEKTNFVHAIIKYGSSQQRFTNITQEDLDFAATALDPQLMAFFGYKHHGEEHEDDNAGKGLYDMNKYKKMIVKNPQDMDSTSKQQLASDGFIELNDLLPANDAVLQRLRRGGVPESVLHNAGVRSQLPSWSQITSLYGTVPIIEGMDRCEEFRNKVPALERHLGSAGMFNTGTNLITMLLKANCIIPERYEHYGPNATKEQYGMRWQVPWGKHTPAILRLQHHATKAKDIIKEHVLPIVLIRDPYAWMKSMCVHPYTARWPHSQDNCPHIIQQRDKVNIPVTVKFANNHQTNHDSIAHLWNDWYMQYYQDAEYPRLLIRFEDVIFFQEQVTEQVCTCAGGKIRTDRPFQYLVNSAKDGPGHGNDRTGMVDAWIKYGKPKAARGGFSKLDYDAGVEILNKDLMDQFGYHHAPAQ